MDVLRHFLELVYICGAEYLPHFAGGVIGWFVLMPLIASLVQTLPFSRQAFRYLNLAHQESGQTISVTLEQEQLQQAESSAW